MGLSSSGQVGVPAKLQCPEVCGGHLGSQGRLVSAHRVTGVVTPQLHPCPSQKPRGLLEKLNESNLHEVPQDGITLQSRTHFKKQLNKVMAIYSMAGQRHSKNWPF